MSTKTWQKPFYAADHPNGAPTHDPAYQGQPLLPEVVRGLIYAFKPENLGEMRVMRAMQHLPGVQVSDYKGFKLLTVEEPERAVWKYHLIRRLEAWRKDRDEFRRQHSPLLAPQA